MFCFAQGLSGFQPLHSSAYSPMKLRKAVAWPFHSLLPGLSLWFSLLGEKPPSHTHSSSKKPDEE